MWIGKILRKKFVIQLQFIWEHIYGNKEVTILKRAGKGILWLLSDLQNGVNTGAKMSWRRNKMFSMRQFVHIVIGDERIVVDLEWLRGFDRASEVSDALLLCQRKPRDIINK